MAILRMHTGIKFVFWIIITLKKLNFENYSSPCTSRYDTPSYQLPAKCLSRYIGYQKRHD